MSRVIAILNQKGGVGKTTTTVNLGAYLAKAGKNVLVIDFDPQANATSGLGIDKRELQNSVYEALLGQIDVSKLIQKTSLPRLSILPANTGLAATEIELADKPEREKRLKSLTDSLGFDFILIDCPPALGLLTINALAAAHWLIIPVQAEYYALEGLSQLLDVMQKVKQGLNPDLELLGVVATMYDTRNSLAQQVDSELKKYFGDKVFSTVVPRNVRLAEAPSHGKTILEHDKWSKGARAYKQLAKEVMSRVG